MDAKKIDGRISTRNESSHQRGVVEDEPVLGEILDLRRTDRQRMGKAVGRRREEEQEKEWLDQIRFNPMEKEEKSATALLNSC